MSESIQALLVDVGAGDRLSLDEAMAFVSDDGFGGYGVFVGKIRAANLGRSVVSVHYDVFGELALQRFRDIASKAIADSDKPMRIAVAHAKGQVKVGGVAVIVAVGTVHRAEAFDACRAVIEAVKHETPIWKQEHYTDGKSEWSEGCSLCVAEG